jgi:hypothetical protein
MLLCAKVISSNGRSLQAWWSRIRSLHVGSPRPAPAVPTFAMGLRAQRLNEDVEITWGCESAVVVGASSGILSIQDGNSRRDITLDIAQLRSSRVLYSPQSDSVSIQLSVIVSVSTVTESVMLLLPKKGPAKAPTIPPVKLPSARTAKPFTPEMPRAGNRFEPTMAPLPLLTQASEGAADQDSFTILIAQVPVPPPPTQRGGAAVNNVQADSLSQPASYRPAEPIRRVMPRLRPELMTMFTKPATLEVRVSVDETGRVSRAQAVPHAGVNKLVMEQIVTAVRSWTFAPARRGDEPVISEFVLQFYFGR